MELNFSEIDHYTESPQQQNYWDIQNKPSIEPKKRNKVTFDDILSNMNLVVNDKGVLQYMAPLQQEHEYPNNYNYYQNQQPVKVPLQVRVNKQQIKPLEPEVKNSTIFNKYFKDYKDPNASQQVNVRVPKTIEEYKQMLLEDKIKRIQERNRIAQIKSTKLLFTNVGTIQATNNSRRKMGFN
jgi:hypothetical protein